MNIIYRDNINNEPWDVTTIVSRPRWNTARRGRAGSFTFEAIKYDGFYWTLGAYIEVKNGEQEIFKGRITKIEQSEKSILRINAHDQLFYLRQNKQTYEFIATKATEILTRIASDFGLSVGTLEDTGYIIPRQEEDNQSLLDIITRALDWTIVNTREMYCLYDDFGKLCIKKVSSWKHDTLIGDESLATGYAFNADIESDTYNVIKLLRNNKEKSQRDAVEDRDSEKIKTWGMLQYVELVDEKMNTAQMAERANMLKELKNRPTQSFQITAIADLNVRAGMMIPVVVSEVGFQSDKNFFVVEECQHDLAKEKMRLTLKVM